MNSHLTFSLLALLPALSLAAVYMEQIEEHEDHPGKCFVGGVAYSDGDSWNSESSCQRLTCTTYTKRSGEQQFLVITSTCPSVAAEPPCYLVENKTASYPDCCPRFECPPIETADAHLFANDVIDNTFDVSDNEIEHEEHIMMESRIPEPVRLAAPLEEDIASYDVTLSDDDVTDFSSSPFRSFVPTRYGKPILQFRRRKWIVLCCHLPSSCKTIFSVFLLCFFLVIPKWLMSHCRKSCSFSIPPPSLHSLKLPKSSYLSDSKLNSFFSQLRVVKFTGFAVKVAVYWNFSETRIGKQSYGAHKGRTTILQM